MADDTLVMVRPETGDRYDIPPAKLSDAIRGGLIMTAPMVDAKGGMYDIPFKEVPAAKEAGLTGGPGFARAFSLLSTPVLDEKGHPFRDPRDTRPALNDMGPLEKLWHDMNQGGPGDWRNILNAIGPIASTVTVPIMGAKSLGGRATLEAPTSLMEMAKLGLPPSISAGMGIIPKAGELAPETLQIIGRAAQTPMLEAVSGAANLPIKGALAAKEAAVAAALMSGRFIAKHPYPALVGAGMALGSGYGMHLLNR